MVLLSLSVAFPSRAQPAARATSSDSFDVAVLQRLTLVDAQGKEVDMGTPFDSFDPLAQPQLEERFLIAGKLSGEQVANRKVLRAAMTKAGFIQLPVEWWHFDALTRVEIQGQYKIVEEFPVP